MADTKELLQTGKIFNAKTEELAKIGDVSTFSLEKPPERVLFSLPHGCKEIPDEVIAWTEYYLATTYSTEMEFHKTRGEKTNSYERFTKVNLPSMTSLALMLKTSQETVTAWGKKFPKFQAYLNIIKAKQKTALIEGGLSGQFNSGFSKFLLNVEHGMREGVDITSNGNTIESFGMGHEALAKRNDGVIDVTNADNE